MYFTYLKAYMLDIRYEFKLKSEITETVILKLKKGVLKCSHSNHKADERKSIEFSIQGKSNPADGKKKPVTDYS